MAVAYPLLARTEENALHPKEFLKNTGTASDMRAALSKLNAKLVWQFPNSVCNVDLSGHYKATINTARRTMGNLVPKADGFDVAHDVLAAGECSGMTLSPRRSCRQRRWWPRFRPRNSPPSISLTQRRIYITRDDKPVGDSAMASHIELANKPGIDAMALSPRLETSTRIHAPTVSTRHGRPLGGTGNIGSGIGLIPRPRPDYLKHSATSKKSATPTEFDEYLLDYHATYEPGLRPMDGYRRREIFSALRWIKAVTIFLSAANPIYSSSPLIAKTRETGVPALSIALLEVPETRGSHDPIWHNVQPADYVNPLGGASKPGLPALNYWSDIYAKDKEYRRGTTLTATVDSSDQIAIDAVDVLLQSGKIYKAIEMLEGRPATDKLAANKVLLGDLISIMAGEFPDIGAEIVAKDEGRMMPRLLRMAGPQNVDAMRLELRHRLQVLKIPKNMLSANVLSVSDEFDNVLLIDQATSRLYVIGMMHNVPELRARFFMRLGEKGVRKQFDGDMRSPTGAYRIVHEMSGEKLNPMYGPFAWQLDFPNPEDRSRGRNGTNIWIHGSPTGMDDRSVVATEGCFALSNADLNKLKTLLNPDRTLVLSAGTVDWVEPELWKQRRTEIRQTKLPNYFPSPKAAPPFTNDYAAKTIVKFEKSGGYYNYDTSSYNLIAAQALLNKTSDAKTSSTVPISDVVAVNQSTVECRAVPKTANVRQGGATLTTVEGHVAIRNLRSNQLVTLIHTNRQDAIVEVDGQVGSVYAPLLITACRISEDRVSINFLVIVALFGFKPAHSANLSPDVLDAQFAGNWQVIIDLANNNRTDADTQLLAINAAARLAAIIAANTGDLKKSSEILENFLLEQNSTKLAFLTLRQVQGRWAKMTYMKAIGLATDQPSTMQLVLPELPPRPANAPQSTLAIASQPVGSMSSPSVTKTLGPELKLQLPNANTQPEPNDAIADTPELFTNSTGNKAQFNLLAHKPLFFLQELQEISLYVPPIDITVSSVPGGISYCEPTMLSFSRILKESEETVASPFDFRRPPPMPIAQLRTDRTPALAAVSLSYATTPSVAVASDESVKNELRDKAHTWANAWSSKNVEQYYRFYADEFRQLDDDSEKALTWEKHQGNWVIIQEVVLPN
eukprot:gene1368-1386_t